MAAASNKKFLDEHFAARRLIRLLHRGRATGQLRPDRQPTGNEWGDLDFYSANQIPVWVPIFDYAAGNGANGYYHIVGFGAIILTGDNEHAKWLQGAGIAHACGRGGAPRRRLLHRAGWGLHDRRHRRGPPRPLGVGGPPP